MVRYMTPVRVLIIEDHFLARMALHSVLSVQKDVQIVGEAADGTQGIAMYRELLPDVVLLDLRLPRVTGFDVLAEIRRTHPASRFIVLSNYSGSEDIYRALRAGAMGYLTKDASGEEVVNAIGAVVRGMRHIPPAVLNRLAERMPAMDLTPREAEVLTCITRGRSNREIGEELGIAEKTVRIHVSSVLEKMGARDRTQATIFAIQRGLVHLD